MQRVDLAIGTTVLLAIVLLNPAQAELKVGVATTEITPPVGGKMAGYSARGENVSTGVHDPLTARTLVIDDGQRSLAVVTLDLAGLPNDASRTVRDFTKQQTQIDLVLILCSHTHSGPDSSPDFPSKEKPWLAEAVNRIVATAVQANDAKVPATYGVAKGEAREGHNRRKVAFDGSVTMFWRNEKREPTAPVDYEVGVVRFQGLDDKPIATLVNFTCHPVVLGPKNLLFSADYPGVMRSVVEESVGGTCLFANGACGDINPYMDKSDPAASAYEHMEKMGRTIGEEVVRVVRDMKMHKPGEASLTLHTEVIPIEPRWDFRKPEIKGALEKKYGKALVRAYLGRFESSMSAELTTITLGDDLAIVGLPGEFFVEHGLSLKARSAIPNTFALGYCNGMLGYFPTINAAWEGGYGAREATVVEVGAGEKIVNRALVNLYYETGRLQRIPTF